MPRKLSDSTCSEKAKELIECLMMWGIERADAYVITREMKYSLQNMSDNDYQAKNPTLNSGLSADQILESGFEKVKDFQFPSNGENILEFPRKKS